MTDYSSVGARKERHWSRLADTYRQKGLYVVGAETVQAMVDSLSAERELGDVLEFGCGPGHFSVLLAGEATSLTCTDLSDEMLAAARQHLGSFPNVTVQKADCMDSGFAPECFDTVVIVNVIHVVARPSLALAESYRVLRPGGRLIAMDVTSVGMSWLERSKLGLRYLRTFGAPPRQGDSGLSPQRLGEWVEAAGFSVERAEMLDSPTGCVYLTATRSGSPV